MWQLAHETRDLVEAGVAEQLAWQLSVAAFALSFDPLRCSHAVHAMTSSTMRSTYFRLCQHQLTVLARGILRLDRGARLSQGDTHRTAQELHGVRRCGPVRCAPENSGA